MKAFISLLLLTVVAADKVYDAECPPEQANDWTIEKLLRHEDCDKFYKCTFGKPVELLCPANLWFNLDTWQCDYPHNVDCSGRNEPTLAPPAVTSTSPVSTSAATTTTTPSSTTSSTNTTTPQNTTTAAEEALTSTSTTPSPTTNTTATTTPSPTTNSSTSETTTTEIELNGKGCPVNHHVHWLLPHETNCNLFYYCVWGDKVQRQCPSTLHFDKVKQVCDFSYRAGCSTSFDKNARRRREILSD